MTLRETTVGWIVGALIALSIAFVAAVEGGLLP